MRTVNKSFKKRTQLPLNLRAGRKTDARVQFAALCYRISNDRVEVCLVTSRGTGRWILPKGWPMHKQTPASAAATEAYEEAGLSGKAYDHCLGVYAYVKPLKKSIAPVMALIYPVRVKNVHSDWPEKHQRKRKWFSLSKAARKLDDPQLRRIVLQFDPHKLPH